jgi:hypothetical protein
LRALRKAGHTIILVTARPPFCIMDTIRSCRTHNIPFDRVYHCSGYLGESQSTMCYTQGTLALRPLPFLFSKKDVFSLEKPSIVVDDRPEYVLEASSANIPFCILVGHLHNKRWRDTNKDIFPEIIMATPDGWEGVENSIIGIVEKV